MELRKIEGKNVIIKDTDGNIFEGKAIDYIFPDDNEPKVESIIMREKYEGELIEFYAPDIKSIEIIQ